MSETARHDDDASMSGGGLLAGCRAIVTGGASGLGQAAVLRMRSHGATVAIVDRRSETGNATDLRYEVDVTDPDRFAEAATDAAERMGGLTALVNAAGVGLLSPLINTPAEKWRRVVDVNLTGTFFAIRACAPLMSHGGSIVNLASTSAIRPAPGEASYAAAKAGVVALTASAAIELAPLIRVNAVSPGPVNTPLLQPYLDRFPSERERFAAVAPLGRFPEPNDISGAIVFLCSDLSSFITGTNIVVDGGMTLRGTHVEGMLERLAEAGDDPNLRPDYGGTSKLK